MNDAAVARARAMPGARLALEHAHRRTALRQRQRRSQPDDAPADDRYVDLHGLQFTQGSGIGDQGSGPRGTGTALAGHGHEAPHEERGTRDRTRHEEPGTRHAVQRGYDACYVLMFRVCACPVARPKGPVSPAARRPARGRHARLRQPVLHQRSRSGRVRARARVLPRASSTPSACRPAPMPSSRR